MVERLPQHRHCIECGKAVTSDAKYCSDECKDKNEARLARRRRQLLTLYAGSFALFVLALLLFASRL